MRFCAIKIQFYCFLVSICFNWFCMQKKRHKTTKKKHYKKKKHRLGSAFMDEDYYYILTEYAGKDIFSLVFFLCFILVLYVFVLCDVFTRAHSFFLMDSLAVFFCLFCVHNVVSDSQLFLFCLLSER